MKSIHAILLATIVSSVPLPGYREEYTRDPSYSSPLSHDVWADNAAGESQDDEAMPGKQEWDSDPSDFGGSSLSGREQSFIDGDVGRGMKRGARDGAFDGLEPSRGGHRNRGSRSSRGSDDRSPSDRHHGRNRAGRNTSGRNRRTRGNRRDRNRRENGNRNAINNDATRAGRGRRNRASSSDGNRPGIDNDFIPGDPTNDLAGLGDEQDMPPSRADFDDMLDERNDPRGLFNGNADSLRGPFDDARNPFGSDDASIANLDPRGASGESSGVDDGLRGGNSPATDSRSSSGGPAGGEGRDASANRRPRSAGSRNPDISKAGDGTSADGKVDPDDRFRLHEITHLALNALGHGTEFDSDINNSMKIF